MNSKRNGVTLVELIVAIPVFAFVLLAVTSLLTTSSENSVINYDLLKCQVAASNLITYIEATEVAVDSNGEISGCDSNGVLGSDISPDKFSEFRANITSSDGLSVVTVTKGEISVAVKTYFPAEYFKS